MQLKVDLLDVDGHIFVAEWPQVARPGMRVPVVVPLLAKVARDVSVHDWLDERDPLHMELY